MKTVFNHWAYVHWKRLNCFFWPAAFFCLVIIALVSTVLFVKFAHADTATEETTVSVNVLENPTPPSPVPSGGGGGGGYTVYGGTANVTFRGIAYPGARVVILKDGITSAISQADPGARFQVQFNKFTAGNYTFAVYAQDSSGRKSPPVSFQLMLTEGVNMEVSDIFLAPTIGLDYSEVKKGDTLNVFGFSAPKAEVNLFINSEKEQVTKLKSDTSGAWFKAVDTSFLDFGAHTAKSKALVESKISPFSEEASFIVGNKSVKQTAKGKERSDFNGDGKVNIVDFSILLYFWREHNPANPKVDINQDNLVDLKDLSIMLYDWTG